MGSKELAVRMLSSSGHCWRILAMAAGFLAGIGTALGSSMGWNDNFNDYSHNQPLNGQKGWEASASVVAQTNVFRGTNGLAAKVPGNAGVTNTFGVTVSKTWTDFYLKPNIGDLTNAVDSTAAVAFYFNGDSNPVVCNGTSWVPLTGVQVDPSNWVRVTVFQSFRDRTWALFIDGEYVTGGLAFANSALSNYTEMVVTHVNEDDTVFGYLDDMWVYQERPDGVTSNANSPLTGDFDDRELTMSDPVMPDAWELDYFHAISQRPGWDYDGDGVSDDQEYRDGTDPTDPASCIRRIPWRESWEAATVGTLSNGWHGWTYTGTAVVQTGSTVEGSKALALSSETAETASMALALATNPPGTNVWCLVYTKPTFGQNDPIVVVTNDASAFYVATGGILRALSGTTWEDVMHGIPSNTWLAFAAHLDYPNATWDLYVSTNGQYGGSLSRANQNPLAFHPNAPVCFTQLVVESAYTVLVDVVAVSMGYTNVGVASLTNVLACDRLAGRQTLIGRPPYDYDSATGQDTMGGQLGNDLALGLADCDRIRAYVTNAWFVYDLNDDSWVPYDTNLHISATMGLALQRRGGMDNVVFYPYGTSPTLTDPLLYGTNWTFLTWPFSPTRANEGSKWCFANRAGSGDRIFIYENHRYRDLYWKNGEWKEDGATAIYLMKTGQGFWHYRASPVTTNWPISSYPP